MTYFIVSSTGEGGARVEAVSEKDLLARITPDKDGYTYYGGAVQFLNAIPKPDFWDYTDEEKPRPLVIIRGEVIVPKSKQVVKAYEL